MGKKGKTARKDGRPYHTVSEEDHPVYHNQRNCDEGKKIKTKNLKPGKDGRALCEICEGM